MLSYPRIVIQLRDWMALVRDSMADLRLTADLNSVAEANAKYRALVGSEPPRAETLMELRAFRPREIAVLTECHAGIAREKVIENTVAGCAKAWHAHR